MTTTIHTDVDGATATVIHREPDRQIPLVELEAEDLCQLLAAKDRQLHDQDDVVDREKKFQKKLELQREEIVQELRKRGEAAASAQTGLFDKPQRTYPPKNASAKTVAEEAVPQRGSKRLALTGAGEIVFDGKTGAPIGGAYERIPQEAEPTLCVCGAMMTSTLDEHDAAHAEYARSIATEIAPGAVAATTS